MLEKVWVTAEGGLETDGRGGVRVDAEQAIRLAKAAIRATMADDKRKTTALDCLQTALRIVRATEDGKNSRRRG